MKGLLRLHGGRDERIALLYDTGHRGTRHASPLGADVQRRSKGRCASPALLGAYHPEHGDARREAAWTGPQLRR
jgi:hypothetical protein